MVDALAVRQVDLDVERSGLRDREAVHRRNLAVRLLEQAAARAGRPLRLSYTLPADEGGLSGDAQDLLRDAARTGVEVEVVNVMTMDAGTEAPDLARVSAPAAEGTEAFVRGLWPGRASGGSAWGMIAVTPMIGRNDLPSEVFGLDDAARLVAFARAHGLAWLSFWSLNRDRPCVAGTGASGAGGASPACSGVGQRPGDFTAAFDPGRDLRRALGTRTGPVRGWLGLRLDPYAPASGTKCPPGSESMARRSPDLGCGSRHAVDRTGERLHVVRLGARDEGERAGAAGGRSRAGRSRRPKRQDSGPVLRPHRGEQGHRPRVPTSARSRHTPIVFSKRWGPSSPQLFAALTTQGTPPMVRFEFNDRAGRRAPQRPGRPRHHHDRGGCPMLSSRASSTPPQRAGVELELVSLSYGNLRVESPGGVSSSDDWATGD